VLGVTAIKDAIEDFRRHQSAKEMNSRRTMVCDAEKRAFVETTWAEVRVGHVAMVRECETFPADMILIKSAAEDSQCVFVETSSLDGESNLKRHVVPQAVASRIDAADPTTILRRTTCIRIEFWRSGC
jgi:phospholipid-transporting ATPase